MKTRLPNSINVQCQTSPIYSASILCKTTHTDNHSLQSYILFAMASVFPISLLVTNCNFRRFTRPCESKFVKTCNSVIKSVTRTTDESVLPEPIIRRSGNYKPCMWDDKFLQSLKTDYTVCFSFSIYIHQFLNTSVMVSFTE